MKPTEKRPVNEKERCRGHAHSINSQKQVPLVLICMYILEDLPRMTTFVLHVIFSSANSDYPGQNGQGPAALSPCTVVSGSLNRTLRSPFRLWLGSASDP